jgi:hypothetical protein
VYDEGIGDMSVSLRSGGNAAAAAAAFARTREWTDDASLDSVSDSVSESGSRRVDGRAVA